MSRHRNVRSMNYEEEYDGYDDVYGHSVEDDYCISPATAAQFLYNRDAISSLSSYMKDREIPEEDEEEGMGSDQESADPMQDSGHFTKPILSDDEQAQLNSCLEEIRNVIGDSTPEHVLVDAVMKHKFNFELALDYVLCQKEKPKPQREPRQRRSRPGAAPTMHTYHDDTAARVQNGGVASQPVENSITHVTNDIARMTFSMKGDTSLADQAISGPNQNAQHKVTDDDEPKPAAVQNVSSEHMLGVVSSTVTGGAAAASSSSDSLIATPKRESQSSAAKRRQEALKEYEKRRAEGKGLINLVVIGHVDAGKSTLMGHLLYQLGSVNKKTMHKYEQESKKLGKASFAYAWVLDETEEERSRGVTMDVAQTRFETDNKSITLLDAPGHKDFIPNMITGAAQADVAILVVNATRGEFETGFEMGGQTREHAMLIRSLGVSQLLVALNKMDTVDWASDRYQEIQKKISHFLKQTGFKDADVSFVPCSGLSGENLTKPPTETQLTTWYKGPTLLQQIDKFKSPERDVDKALRLCVGDVYKGMGAGFSVAGTLQAGYIQAGDKVLVMPHGETANVKGVMVDEVPVQRAFAGDTVALTLTGMDIANVNVGSIVCDISNPIRTTTRFRARVVIFSIDLPITKGFPVVLHYQSVSEPANIRKLISQLHKGTGEVIKKKPRCLVKNTSAIVEIEIGRPICLELYKDFKDLGRFMLRYGGITIAAGLVTEILDEKATKD